jgi:hypothetical protein
MLLVWITAATGWFAAIAFIVALCRAAARGDAVLAGAR